jgi:protein dithiol oxidoreductase (disulfide-forming)
VRITTLWMVAAAAVALCGAQRLAAQPSASQPHAAAPAFEAGKHYTELPGAQPASADLGKVEVAEVFMFGCPACFGFEPHLQKWLATKPDYVSFIRIPARWNPVAELHARAFYTAELLRKSAEIEEPFFMEYHANGNRLDTEAKIAALFARFGVDATTFNNTFHSFGVDAQLGRAKDLVERYGVRSTPTVVVNGKYLTTGPMAGTYEAWLAIIDQLVAAEHEAPARE